jgi:hypothetical protein
MGKQLALAAAIGNGRLWGGRAQPGLINDQ